MKKKSLISIAVLLMSCLLVYLLWDHTNNRNDNKSENHVKPYFETPSIHTCSNSSDLFFELRYVEKSKNEEGIECNIGISNEKVSIERTSIKSITANDNTIYTISFYLNTPPGEALFDLNVAINGENYVIKNITNHNFNTEEIVPRSIHASETFIPLTDSDSNEFVNRITLDNKDITNIEFGVLSEKLVSVDKIDSHSADIVTEATEPGIVGYYIVENNQKACISNVYHTYELSNYDEMLESATNSDQ